MEIFHRRERFEKFACEFELRYAAFEAALGAAIAAVSSHFTETSFETPGSCIVTP